MNTKPSWWMKAIAVAVGIVWLSWVIGIAFVVAHFVEKFW